jgi:N-acetylglucosamine repressor
MNIFKHKKNLRERRLLAYIWSRRGQAVRSDIISHLRLSRATVIAAVDRLLCDGVILEQNSTQTKKGRRPKSLMINGEQCFAIGISIIKGEAQISVVNGGLGIVGTRRVVDLPLEGARQLCVLLEHVQRFMAEHNLERSKLVGLGVSMPGMIDHNTGIVRRSACFTDGDQAPIIPFWMKHLEAPCRILGCTDAMTLAEKEWGAAAKMDSFLYFDGAGVGMFLNGRLYMGSQNYGGEIGFMKIADAPVGELDGRYGTLKMLTRLRDLRRRAEEAIAQGVSSVLADWLKEGRAFTRDLIAEAACQGDVLGRALVEDLFDVYADMIVNLNYLFNPEAIFLWPWTAKCPDITLELVRRRIALCKLVNPDMHTEVLPAKNGQNELAQGMATFMLNSFFEEKPASINK